MEFLSQISQGISTFVLGEEDDDPSCLKDPSIMAVYEAPHKNLGVSLNATPWELRDALRKNCVSLLGRSMFNTSEKPLLPYKHSLIAFHLCAETIRVKKAQDLKRYLDDQPHLFRGRPLDVLQLLRPVHCEGIVMNGHVRACALLHVVYDDVALCQEAGDVLPHQKYVCRVSYCGRVHFVRPRYSEFKALNEAVAAELLMVPGFPSRDALFKMGLRNTEQRGVALCRYVNRIHASLGARGMFSPRVLLFLEIDAARVHIEEDGRVSKMLDSRAAVSGSAWHMVDELWLKKWRKFVLGRAARRYEPPGPITNERLLLPRSRPRSDRWDESDRPAEGEDRATTVPIPERRSVRPDFPATVDATVAKYADGELDGDGGGARRDRDGAREPAAIGVHYRAVNYNLWIYWKMVHGGGPCISRKTKDILSQPACGSGAEAVSRLQRFARGAVAKADRCEKYWKALSRTAPGVREVLADYEQHRIRSRVDRVIKAAKVERTSARLALATRYTQRMWRSKKAYAFNDDNVRVMKHAQEIFALADGEVEHASAGAPFVVEEGEAIVAVGATEQFDIKFTEADGPSLPIVLKKHACSELTFVHTVDAKALIPRKGRDMLVPDSVLLTVQAYPVSSLSHDAVMQRLTSARWPLTLRFERPLVDADVTSLADVLELDATHPGGLPDDLKLQMLKRLLSQGIAVRKHGRSGSPHDTILYMNETILFWGVRNAKKLQANSKIVRKKKNVADENQAEVRGLSMKYDLTKAVSLYDLKYVRVGKISPALRRSASRRAADAACFTLFAEGRTLDFETVAEYCDVGAARTAFAWAFDKIIEEARGTKIFVDKTGAPITRTAPKKRLRMIVGA